MKTTLKLKTYTIGIIFTLLLITTTTAQVGINTTTPSPGALLDISSTDKGLLAPRVDIIDLNTILPITGGSTESLLVYNTNTTTGKGFYYWNGSKWIGMGGDNDWKLAGNSGTTAGTDFIGTTDAQDVVIKSNSIERVRIGTTESVINENGNSYNFRVETNNQTSALFVDGTNDNVGLGTNSPNTSSQLELADNDKGILINRVTLTATDDASPVTSPVNGLMVYNTVTASSGATQVLPGFYYWDSGNWIAMGGTNGRDWSLLGNAGTNPSTNFIGTTDNTAFVLRTNDTERMRFLDVGNAAIGDQLPYLNASLRVNKNAQDFGVVAETNTNIGGAAIYGIETNEGDAVLGVNYGSGIGVVGVNYGTSIGVLGYGANTHGVYGTTAYTGGAFLTAGTVGWGSGADGANGVLAIANTTPSTKSNIGIRVISGSTTSISSTQILTVGVNTNAKDLALYALSEGPITSVGDMEAARFQTNYDGNAITPDTRDPRAQLAGYIASLSIPGSPPINNKPMYYGGYFYSGGNNPAYAYAGADFDNTKYKIIGDGVVSTIVKGATSGDSQKIMFAPEAPEVLFEDYGIGQLTNGIANIAIDPILANNILVDNAHPLKVFIQLEGDCKGVYVTDKTGNGFTVKELQNGNSSVSFSWHIVANRKDTMNPNNTVSSHFSDLRFPDAPSAIIQKGNSATEIKEDKPKKKAKLLSKK